MELVERGASVFHGCASGFEAGAQVVFLDLENSLYVVYVEKGSVRDAAGYSTLQTQDPFVLVTLTDKTRTIYEIDFEVERDGEPVTCRHQGVVGFLKCA